MFLSQHPWVNSASSWGSRSWEAFVAWTTEKWAWAKVLDCGHRFGLKRRRCHWESPTMKWLDGNHQPVTGSMFQKLLLYPLLVAWWGVLVGWIAWRASWAIQELDHPDVCAVARTWVCQIDVHFNEGAVRWIQKVTCLKKKHTFLHSIFFWQTCPSFLRPTARARRQGVMISVAKLKARKGEGS